jgi:hypothetical protein
LAVDGDVIDLAVNTPAGRIEVLTNMTKTGDVLTLDGLHIEGPGANSVGAATLRQLAQQLGRQQGAKQVVINGGARTTGTNVGRAPSFTINVDS